VLSIAECASFRGTDGFVTPIGRYFDERKVKLAFYAPEGASPRVEPHLDNSGKAVRLASS
jgi:hypothetical protein